VDVVSEAGYVGSFMARRFEQAWWQADDRPRGLTRARAGASAWSMLLPYWCLALALSYGVHSGLIPARALFAWATAPGAPAPQIAQANLTGWSEASSQPTEAPPASPRTGKVITAAALVDDDWGNDELAAEPLEEETRDQETEAAGEAARPSPASAHVRTPPKERARTKKARRERREPVASAAPESAARDTRARDEAAERSVAPPREASSDRAGSKARASSGGGRSCEAAIAAYREEMAMGGSTPADLTAARYGAVLNRGSYFAHCGVADDMKVKICAAVQNGRALGVTVTTTPGSADKARCIAQAVRGLAFPSHPRMDVTTTVFE
jgi:hypothetical protein